MTDVTVEVKDNNGNVVATKATDIAEGATSAQFDFVTPITNAQQKGVWTVDGKEYSFTELKVVADIVTESNNTPNENQVKLLGLLNDAGIEDINTDLMAEYAVKIDAATPTPEKYTDIQKIVNKVNTDAAKNDAAVKPVLEAKSQIGLLNALKANYERVNEDWIIDYMSGDSTTLGIEVTAANVDNDIYVDASGTKDNTAVGIQTVIDAINADQISTEDTNAVELKDQAKVTTLIQNWMEADNPETPLVTPKADAIKDSQIKEAAFRIAEATTGNSLYNALVAYANITPDATLKASELNTNLKAFYLDELDTAGVRATLVSAIQGGTDDIKGGLVTDTDAAAVEAVAVDLGAAATAYKTTDNAANKAAFKAELVKLEKYTSHKTVKAEKFLMSTIDETLLLDYATKMDTDGIATGKDVSDVQTSIKAINDAKEDIAMLKDINKATTAQQVKVVLDKLAVTEYVNVPSADKLHIAEQVLELRDTLAAGRDALDSVGSASGNTTTLANEFVDLDEIEGELVVASTGVIAVYDALVAEFVYSGLTDTATTVTQLGKLKYDAFDNLAPGQKALVAEAFKANYPMDETPAAIDYTTLAAVKTAIDTAIAGL